MSQQRQRKYQTPPGDVSEKTLAAPFASERVLRVYRAFCAISELLGKQAGEAGLLREICKVFVTHSGYRMVWIGYPGQDPERRVQPVACFGVEEGYLNRVHITWSELPSGRGPTGTAIRSGRPQVIRFVRTDPSFLPWRDEAIQCGFESSASFPICEPNGNVFAVLSLYAAEPDAFDQEEVEAITYLTRLIAYGILSIRSDRSGKRLLVQARARASELQTVLDNMTESIFVCDLDGRVVIANRSGIRLLGARDLNEVRAYSWEKLNDIWPRADKSDRARRELDPLARALKGEVVTLYDENLRLPGASSDIVVRTNAAPIYDEKCRIVGALKVVREITEAVEYEKLKDEFVENAAHELKTPVTAIKGYCQILQREPEVSSEKAQALLEKINQGTVRIDRIINHLLDMSRMQLRDLTLHLERFDLAGLVSEVVCSYGMDLNFGRLKLGPLQSAPVSADRARIARILRNLIDNAIKFSPEGGEIDIRLQVLDQNAMVSVRDRGIGIPAGEQFKVFERFTSVHAKGADDYGGLGIALYLSKEIIRRHGGKIGFESEHGVGSRFWFQLPIEQESRDERSNDPGR